MKKFAFAAALTVVLGLFQVAYGNMAAPAEPDVGTAITLEENDDLAVRSEVLDITITGPTAQITATYQMENTSDEPVTTRSMFLSPNIGTAGTKVLAGGEEVPFEARSYALNYDTQVAAEDWRYVVLAPEETAAREPGRTVDAIEFSMDFEPGESSEVVVSYTYALGGYPSYDFDAKRGELHYYLTPAALWKDFGSLTINLTLGEDMPVLKSSNLEFEKVGDRTYRYQSDHLPEEDLRIVVDENWYQNFFSTLRSPYLHMTLRFLAPFILIAAAGVILAVWSFRRRRRNRSDRSA